MAYPTIKGTLQSSENYTWNTADSLGRGASAIVYLGRGKKDGKVVAIKCFHRRLFPDSNDWRELTLLSQLRHDNIVRALDIEHEQISNNPVVVMNYCECSLYSMLSKPEYAYGLPEDEFLLVLEHVGAGLEYLRLKEIVHRDIKPGNIMRAVTEDGNSVYKLTDFGAARELNDEETYTSMYGTEEYLHPGIFERAVLHLPTSKSFNSKSDLWSLGVTLYHTATGYLPFHPHGGRQDRETMFRIISQKESGVISGIQNVEDGPITFSRILPSTCPLSCNLKAEITPIIAGLMEPDESIALSYEDFFCFTKMLTKKVCLTVIDYNTITELKLYINGQKTISDLRENIASHTDITASSQLLLVRGWPLDEIVDTETQIESFPHYVLKGTIYLFSDVMEIENNAYSNIPEKPKFRNVLDMDSDLKLSEKCLSRAYMIKRYSEEIVKNEVHLIDGELCLRSFLLWKLKNVSETFLQLHVLIQQLRKRFDTFYFVIKMIDDIAKSLGYNEKDLNEILNNKTLTSVQEKADERAHEIIQYRTALMERVEEKSKNGKWSASCKDTNCLTKIRHHLKEIASISARFRRDKNVKDQMTSHDQRIHGFERQSLQHECVAISSILIDHCQKNLEIMCSEASGKISELKKDLLRITKIEKNIQSVVDCHNLLSEKFGKTEEKTASKLKNFQVWAAGYAKNRLLLAAPMHCEQSLTGMTEEAIDDGQSLK